VAESLGTKYHLEPATCHKVDIDSGRNKDSGARLTYELRNYVTTLPVSSHAADKHSASNKISEIFGLYNRKVPR
jgi:hypothetical protein